MDKTRIVIVEDEQPASDRLIRLLSKTDGQFEVVQVLDSLQQAVLYFAANSDFDLIFMDIQLGDGLSLDIFDDVSIRQPIIFVTAFDDYTLKAFKVNSIDYLLKPIDLKELQGAIAKYQLLKHTYVPPSTYQKLQADFSSSKKKERFLVKQGASLKVIPTTEIAHFYSEDSYLHLITSQGEKFIIDGALHSLIHELDDQHFFQVNRKFIIHIKSIHKIEPYFNSRLVLHLLPKAKEKVIVARERCKEFKEWLG